MSRKFFDRSSVERAVWLGTSSRMADVYVHLSGKEVDKALLRINGIEMGDSDKGSFRLRNCIRCEETNPPTMIWEGRGGC